MQIDERFTFGKYKGLSVKEIYHGSNKIAKQLLKNYMLEKISTSGPIVIAEATYANIEGFMNFEIGDTLLRATPLGDIKKDWAKLLEAIFYNGSSFFDKLIGRININDYIRENAKVVEKVEIIDAHPEYLTWCIKNVDDFYIDPEELEELQSLNIYRFIGVEIIHKIEDIYEYKPKINIVQNRFSISIIEENQNKYDSSNTNNYSSDNYFGEEDDLNSWSECGACQESPCRCSDKDIG